MSDQGSRGILCAGSIVFDILVKPVSELRFGTTTLVDSIEYRVGGNAANTARALAILGVPVRIVGALGFDAPADMVLDQLQTCGINTEAVSRRSVPTATSVALISCQGERQFLHRLGASSEAFAEPIVFTEDCCKHCSHLHLASCFVIPNLRKNAAQMLATARVAGLTTSFDTNWDPQGEWLAAIQSCLPHIDMFFMNEDESYMLSGSRDPAAAAHILMGGGATQVVIKLGPGGCAIYNGENEIVCPAFPIDAVDTTGAGDCFVAGFLAARRQGMSLAEAGLFGNAVGALTVQQIGAVEGVVPVEKVREWMLSQSSASKTS